MVYTNIIKHKASIGYYKCKQVIGEGKSGHLFFPIYTRDRTDGHTHTQTDGHLHLYICAPSAADKKSQKPL